MYPQPPTHSKSRVQIKAHNCKMVICRKRWWVSKSRKARKWYIMCVIKSLGVTSYESLSNPHELEYHKLQLCKFNEIGMYVILAKYLSTFSKTWILKIFWSWSYHLAFNYLDLTTATAGTRALLVKLRKSNHKLMIDIGKYNQTTKDNRHCPFCGSNLIEDEIHFLFRCTIYSVIRNKFHNQVKSLIPNITQLPIKALINEQMNSSNYFISIQFIEHISACFDLRGKLLPK